MEYRVEHKYLVTDLDLELLSSRLKTVMKQDVHQKNGSYEIRSLYFDDVSDRCMNENEAGFDQRKKYRIRTYDGSSDVIHLEVKEKYRGFTKKSSCELSQDECKEIISGSLPLSIDGRKALNQLKLQWRCSKMEPKVIVSYERTAFVYPVGNVRVTFDRNITASRNISDFFDNKVSALFPVLPTGVHILEVKYDEFLPDFIAEQLEIGKLRQTAFSKYYLGRLALLGEFPADI